MSWLKQHEFLREIEQKIGQGNITLREVLESDHIVTAVKQKLSRLSRFLADNIRQLIDFLASKDPANSKFQRVSAEILTGSQYIVRESLIRVQSNLAYFIDKIYEDDTDKAMLLYVLSDLVEDTNCGILLHVKEPITFFSFVASRIGDSPFYEFAHTILANQTVSAERFIGLASITETLIRELHTRQSSQNIEKLLRLLGMLLLFGPKLPQVLKTVETVENVKLILEIGLESHNVRVSEAAFRVIIALCNLCDDKDTPSSSDASPFETIMNLLEESCHQLAVFIQRDYSFESDKRYAMELITTVISTKDSVPQVIFTLASFVLGLFFEHKTNSFLHCAFFSLFQALSIMKAGFVEFVVESQIFTEILDRVEHRGEISASYWGSLHEIAGILNTLDVAKICPDPERWAKYISECHEKETAVMQAPYGGELPKPDDRLKYRCILADSQDMLSGLDSGSSSSSDSTSSSDDQSFSEESEDETGIDGKWFW